jgi:hypothetical protein
VVVRGESDSEVTLHCTHATPPTRTLSAPPVPFSPPQRTNPQTQALFESIVAGLLTRVRDHNGRVQEAACSGLAEAMEHAGHCMRGAVLLPRLQVCVCPRC